MLVVTFKKAATSPETQVRSVIVSRKRKKPGAVPNQSSLGDKTRLGAAPPTGGIADPLYDPDKDFYENLPFHSMQNPPNKPFLPADGDLVYADLDDQYGPINYKAASIYAAMKRNKNNNRLEEADDKAKLPSYNDLL
ncbi:hypothetical protein HHI36_019513 [Cryptolaemus montrouzieri]|uniref:Uncharacterized protein n=1 Tax=Cryptolaemus montrouzieri TaxID=559131 RepID=A0ABD2P3B6_9CUCU